MTRRPDTDEQRWILGEMSKGRKIGPVLVRRGSNHCLRFGFSDREPAHAHAIEGLLRRGRLIRRNGQIVGAE